MPISSTELESSGLSSLACSLILDQLRSEKPPAHYELVLRKIGSSGEGYAIKDEDFPVLQESAKLVAGLLVEAVSPWAPLAIAELVILLFDFRRKRVPVSTLQLAMLKELKDHGPLSASEIAKILNVRRIDEATIERELTSLANTRKENGTKVELVSKNQDGCWQTEGI